MVTKIQLVTNILQNIKRVLGELSLIEALSAVLLS